MPVKTADLCDADDTAQPCVTQFHSWGRLWSFEGPIRTVRCYEEIGLIRRVLSEPGSGCVLVIDGGGSLRRALFGDVMAGAAIRNGWSGVIVHGAVRDAAEIDTMLLGVKALGVCPRRGALSEAGQADVPVAFGEATFIPGHWLVADNDGVVVLAHAPGNGSQEAVPRHLHVAESFSSDL